MKYVLYIFGICISILLANRLQAQEINQKTAEQLASTFMQQACTAQSIEKYAPAQSECSIISDNGKALIYAIHFLDGGFVLISASTKFTPIIAYSFNGTYDPNNMPEGFNYLIKSYKSSIKALVSSNNKAGTQISKQWNELLSGGGAHKNRTDAVQPLIKSQWDQIFPYNYYCPEDQSGPGGHAYVGSLATAMAQIMYYYRWPIIGNGENTYNLEAYGQIAANFGATEYQYEGMSDELMDEEGSAIALLLYHAGVSINTNYSPTGSYAGIAGLYDAFVQNFRYTPYLSINQRSNFTNDQWKNIILNELNAAVPLLYGGSDGNIVHSFICDGYDGDSLFHFNFGLGSYGDGYYTLDNPMGFMNDQACSSGLLPTGDYPVYANGYKELNFYKGSIEDGSGPIYETSNNIDASWLINPQTGTDSVARIALSIENFNLGQGDTLFIYDGADSMAPLLGAFVQSNILSGLSSTGNKMYLRFKTDDSRTGEGWLASYQAIFPNYCPETILITNTSGELNDGSGTEFHYQNNTSCSWRIEPAYSQGAVINFNYFQTEGQKDILQIFDGEDNTLLAEYSGYYPLGIVPEDVASESGKFLLTFTSDHQITDKGWSLNYMADNVGINTTEYQENIHIWPNPAQDYFYVNCCINQNESIDIYLFATNGSLVLSQRDIPKGITQKIDTNLLPKGIYILKCCGNQHIEYHKIVIQ